MSLPFSNRKGTNTEGTGTQPGTYKPGVAGASTARTSTSNSSNRPFSTSSRSISISSKNSSLPEKQLLNRYRHVYAGKGGWFQQRNGPLPQSNYSSGSSTRYLDVYRRDMIMKMTKDIFENTKQKLDSALVGSNKVAGDAVQNVTTKLGEEERVDFINTDDDRLGADSSESQYIINRKELATFKDPQSHPNTNSKLPIKPVFNSVAVKTQNHLQLPPQTQCPEASSPENNNNTKNTPITSAQQKSTPICFNLRGGSSRPEKSAAIQRLKAPSWMSGNKPEQSSIAAMLLVNDPERLKTSHVSVTNQNVAIDKSRQESIKEITNTDNSLSENKTKPSGRESHFNINPSIVKQSPENGPQEKDVLNNELPESVLFSALKRSNTIHIEHIKAPREGAHLNHNILVPNRGTRERRNETNKGELCTPNGINIQQEYTTHHETTSLQKTTVNPYDQSDKYLPENKTRIVVVEEFVDKDIHTEKHKQHHNSQERVTNDQHLETNSQRKHTANKKDTRKLNKRSAKLESDVGEVLGEIQFNVLRQRSFMRLPKSAKMTSGLESKRPTTRGGGAGGRQVAVDSGTTSNSQHIISRMLSKEARDALNETRMEMRRDSLLKLDTTGLELPSDEPVQTGYVPPYRPEHGHRPPSPKPASSGSSASHANTGGASSPNSGNMNVPNDNQRRRMRTSPKQRSYKHGYTPNNHTRTGHTHTPAHTTQMDSSREKFNRTIEQGGPEHSARRVGRDKTISTPITDLVHAIPKEQQDGFVRYSTNMTKDTAQTPRSNTNRNNPPRRVSTHALPTNLNNNPTTKTHQLEVPDNAHITTHRTNNTKNVANTTSYNVPLKSGGGEDNLKGEVLNKDGLPNEDVASIKSDWESQLRAMSKYGLVTEKSFQITPPGWDERYKDLAIKNARPDKENSSKEVELTLAEVKKEAVEKCSDWLQKYV